MGKWWPISPLSFPAGNWNIYIRGSNPGGNNSDNAEMSGPVSGRFAIPGTGGWGNYIFTPLTDSSGNLVEYIADGSQQTIRLDTRGGSYNVNFYLFLPPYTDTN